MSDNIEQLLIFHLGEDGFGIDTLRVKEIRAVGQIRKIPNMPKYFLGVQDFRSAIVPVLDLRIKMGFENSEISAQTVMLIVNVINEGDDYLIGLVVDAVSDVIGMHVDKLQGAPKVKSECDSQYLKGMYSHNDEVLVVMELDKILDAKDMTGVQSLLVEG